MRPVQHVPRHPLRLTRFGLPAAAPATLLARAFRTPEARALFGGVAAHAFSPLNRPMSSSVGMALICACHRFGWPVARGGSQAIADALAAVVREHGGRIETGRRVRSLDELDDADVTVLDLAPRGVVDVAGAAAAAPRCQGLPPLPPRPGRLQGGPGRGGRDPVDRRAGAAGRHRARHRLVRRDGGRRARGGPRADARAAVRAGGPAVPGRPRPVQRRHPPGVGLRARAQWLRRRRHRGRHRPAGAVRARAARAHRRPPHPLALPSWRPTTPTTWAATSSPAPTPRCRPLVRPRLARDPYATGIPGVYICSAATPPGAGAHGMNGYNAALSALRRLERG